MICFHG